MPIAAKRWNIRPPCPAEHLARFSHLHHLLVRVLYNRGVTDPDEVAAFLEDRLLFDDPYRLAGMEKRSRVSSGPSRPRYPFVSTAISTPTA